DPSPPSTGERGEKAPPGTDSERVFRLIVPRRRLLWQDVVGALGTRGSGMADGSLRQGQVARLLMQHRTALYGYIFACVRNHDDAEAILQNVSVAVTESIGQLHDDQGFLPWAREIARRRVLAHRRQARREMPLDPEVVRRLAEAAGQVEDE